MKKGLSEEARDYLNDIGNYLSKTDSIPDSVMGLKEIIEELVDFYRMDELLNGDVFVKLTLEDDRDLDKEKRAYIERADFLIGFSNLMHKNEWTPMIKARFEKGLEDLGKFIDQGNLSDKKTEGIRSE